MCLAHVRRFSKVRPRYLGVSEFGIGFLFICTGGSCLCLRASTDLFSLILTHQREYQCDRLFRWLWRVDETVSGSVWVAYIALSSAYLAIWVFGLVGWSAEYRLKRVGDTTAPWGTSENIGDMLEYSVSEMTKK
jgi:hypothetical protein